MIVRSKAPLRLGLAGGGTDLPSYANMYGGMVLNVTINMYAHTTIETLLTGEVIFVAQDIQKELTFKSDSKLPIDHDLKLHAGVYNRIVKEFNQGKPLSLKVTTKADSPIGSGLGTSSAIVVSMVKAYVELLKLPLGEYDVAKLSYDIERKDLNLSGGMQDQYAATFGGFNFIEFHGEEHVIVNPLRIRQWLKDEFEASLVLFFTGQSRESAHIIDEQIKHTRDNASDNLSGLHELKQAAIRMKEAILKGNLSDVALELKNGWLAKKKTSKAVTNPLIDTIYEKAIEAGALAGKVSGAGGGGFMMFIVDPLKKLDVERALKNFDGEIRSVEFVEKGTKGWYV
ncbi:bifunctional fucokinase/L-fucose-1-P-guanylyltransferase [Acholeplasma oculi]|uniref:D,D-heptose 7-phosphate kinase n=1 Tax=Acholeplasma oculi TaxID=35623 RepID=A0A061AHT3_9MOLU|nr:dehydrogenase [Acholeplasma oculi]CDR30532.1 D,D-heptose 7-phosphate kinase [Acholeplasma oculi]SKC47507.1 D-glycero-alpha-D-manno-heptose-7-phosphate kinase [Acholeplasma oculi]SUT89195.1 bifunctional fucokinase/L-fucose-1-P-guanylyltransferase [Acholeplasma oculi]